MGAQGLVISFGKSSAGLGDDGGGDDSPDSRQRAENRNVAVLPWFVVLLIRRLKLVEQSLDAGATTLALAVDQTQARQEQGNVFGRRLDYPRRNLKRRHRECRKFCVRSHTMTPLDGRRKRYSRPRCTIESTRASVRERVVMRDHHQRQRFV